MSDLAKNKQSSPQLPPQSLPKSPPKSPNTVSSRSLITRADRAHRYGHRSGIIWFTGLSASGKSTLAHAVEQTLHQRGIHAFVLDGDNVRHGLCGDLDFSVAARTENIRRVGQVANLFTDCGIIVLVALISPLRADRARVRQLCDRDRDFIEVYCHCPLAVCENREVKGLYQRARAGEITDFTGISAPYEAPQNAELVLDTAADSVECCRDHIITTLETRDLLAPPT